MKYKKRTSRGKKQEEETDEPIDIIQSSDESNGASKQRSRARATKADPPKPLVTPTRNSGRIEKRKAAAAAAAITTHTPEDAEPLARSKASKKRGRKASKRQSSSVKKSTAKESVLYAKYCSDTEDENEDDEEPEEFDEAELVENGDKDDDGEDEELEIEAYDQFEPIAVDHTDSEASEPESEESRDQTCSNIDEIHQNSDSETESRDQNPQVPELCLPESSEDLLMSRDKNVLSALATYETLRHFGRLLRLSPFLFEDYCACLSTGEQNALAAEVHMALVRGVLREDELAQASYTPADLKTGADLAFGLCDPVTWPELLRALLESDLRLASGVHKRALQIVSDVRYPFVSVGEKLEVIEVLCDMFTAGSAARNDLASEGNIVSDDHCRVCHRLGQLLCCETCAATYHLECLDPPLTQVPDDDWTCALCAKMQVRGVGDCVSDVEKSGLLVRHEPLGSDRMRRKYWFVARRVVVEPEDGDEVWYYSTKAQLDALIRALDSAVSVERKLLRNITENYEEIVRCMKVTLELTESRKGEAKSYLSELEDRLAAEEECGDKLEDKGSLVPVGEAIRVDDDEDETDVDGYVNPVALSRNLLNINNSSNNVAKVSAGGEVKLYKLGMESAYRLYENEYSVNPLTMNKHQHNQERDRKNILARRFSIQSEMLWKGSVFTSAQLLAKTLAASILAFEAAISPAFLHSGWVKSREAWIARLNAAKEVREFGELMLRLESVMKPLLFVGAWRDSAGYLRLFRETLHEREERKKEETHSKRRAVPHLSALNFMPSQAGDAEFGQTYAHFTRGIKHQVFKQKGEEYRLSGTGGWYWCHAARSAQKTKKTKSGLVDMLLERRIKMDEVQKIEETAPVFKLMDLEPKKKEGPKDDLPPVARFQINRKGPSIFILGKEQARQMARRGGLRSDVAGFKLLENYRASWPFWHYPSARPLLSTCWAFKTYTAPTFAALALQLKYLWACVRWEAIGERAPPNSVTYGNAHEFILTENLGADLIQTSELVSKRDCGPYKLRSEYLIRKKKHKLNSAPAAKPGPKKSKIEAKNGAGATPSPSSRRSGLRQVRPLINESLNEDEMLEGVDGGSAPADANQSSEEWVPEERLHPWQIKSFYERTKRLELDAARQRERLQKQQAAQAAIAAAQAQAAKQAALQQQQIQPVTPKFTVVARPSPTTASASQTMIRVQAAPTTPVSMVKTVPGGNGSPPVVITRILPTQQQQVMTTTVAATSGHVIRTPINLSNVKVLTPSALQGFNKVVRLANGQYVSVVTKSTTAPTQIVTQRPFISTASVSTASAAATVTPTTKHIVNIGGKAVPVSIATTTTTTTTNLSQALTAKITVPLPLPQVVASPSPVVAPVLTTVSSGVVVKKEESVEQPEVPIEKRIEEIIEKKVEEIEKIDENEPVEKVEEVLKVEEKVEGVLETPESTGKRQRRLPAKLNDFTDSGFKRRARKSKDESLSPEQKIELEPLSEEKRAAIMHEIESDEKKRRCELLAKHKEDLRALIKHKKEALEADCEASEKLGVDVADFVDMKKRGMSTEEMEASVAVKKDETEVKNENSEAAVTKRPLRSKKSPLRENDVNEAESSVVTRKRKLSETAAGQSGVAEMSPCSKTSRVGNGMVAKAKYCVCNSEYDKKRFYIQCDTCHNWFHGECVGVTPEHADSIDEYVCAGCSGKVKGVEKKKKGAEELFCLCAKPYDERLFYIGCDRCNGWYHGSCVGVLACEADSLDTYVCPKCLKADAKEWLLDRRVSEKNWEILKNVVGALKVGFWGVFVSFWGFKDFLLILEP